MTDVFRPHRMPAKLFYDIIVDAAYDHETEGHRYFTTIANEIGNERLTAEDLRGLEGIALGHIDYAAKFAYRIVRHLEESDG